MANLRKEKEKTELCVQQCGSDNGDLVIAASKTNTKHKTKHKTQNNSAFTKEHSG